jgi:hypothetical protein
MPLGYWSDQQKPSQTYCGTPNVIPNNGVTNFWANNGGSGIESCGCLEGYIGADCEFKKCNPTLPGLSLGALLLLSDQTLNSFSNQYLVSKSTNYMKLPNSDRSGNDITRYDGISLEACQDKCNMDSRCVTLAYGTNEGVYYCWIKYALGTLTTFNDNGNNRRDVYDKIGK